MESIGARGQEPPHEVPGCLLPRRVNNHQCCSQGACVSEVQRLNYVEVAAEAHQQLVRRAGVEERVQKVRLLGSRHGRLPVWSNH